MAADDLRARTELPGRWFAAGALRVLVMFVFALLGALGWAPVSSAERSPSFVFLAPTTLAAFSVNPGVAIGSHGDAVAVWDRFDLNSRQDVVEAASRASGGAWSIPTTIGYPGRLQVARPHVAVDARGDAVVVWDAFAGPGFAVTAASRPAGGAWSTTTLTSRDGWSGGSQVAAGEGGDPVAVWNRWTATGSVIETASWSPANGWSTPTVLTTDGSSFEPFVAVGKREAVAVWVRSTVSGNVVEAATRWAGGAWSTPTRLTTTEESLYDLRVAVAEKGKAVVVWRRSTASGYVVEATSRDRGAAWSRPTALSALEGSSSDPQVALTDKGKAVAVWTSDSVVEAATRPPGGAWSKPSPLSATGSSGPQVVVADTGAAFVLWTHSTSAYASVVEATAWSWPDAWSTPIRIEDSSREPQVAATGNGEAVAVWVHGTDTTSDVRAAVTKPRCRSRLDLDIIRAKSNG